MRSHLPRSPLLILIASLSCCVSAHAQSSSAQLHVATATGATTFHLGERISLQLDFTASPEAHLAMTTASYDRSGRMSYESFDVSPSTGSSDPLASYFNGDGIFMNGLTSFSPLSSKPCTIYLNLNEWVRFDSPGDYTVTVHSNRVFTIGKSLIADHDHPVTSNPIKLHIIPATPEWQKATLAAAQQALAKSKSEPIWQPSPQTTAAIADIRFLGSAESLPVLAAGLSNDQSPQASQFAFGLIGLPPSLHDPAIRALRQRIDDPDVAVTSSLLMALSALETTPASSPEESFRARDASNEAAMQLALSALPRKTGQAKALTADLILRGKTHNFTPADTAEIARALAPAFTELPEENQASLLDAYWYVLRSAIPPQILQQIASLPVKDAGSNMTPTYDRVRLKSSALHRLYELDPEAAKQAAYAEIGSAQPSLTASSLWFLPSEPLPQFESIWAQALVDPSSNANPEVLAALMVRFGTGAYASHVSAKVRESLGKEACAPQAAMLAYVLKFDPDQGRPLLRAALQARGHTSCYANLFDEVSRYATSAALTDVAIEAIDDPDPETASDTIGYLSLYGDKRSQQPILNRYIAWGNQWAGKGEELQPDPFKPSPNDAQQQLGEALGRALLINEGWITDAQLRSEVLKRCVGEQMCRTLEFIDSPAVPPYLVTLNQFGDGRTYFHVGPYEVLNLDLLKTKLSQYPQGTKFLLSEPAPFQNAGQIAQQVETAFSDAHLILDKYH